MEDFESAIDFSVISLATILALPNMDHLFQVIAEITGVSDVADDIKQNIIGIFALYILSCFHFTKKCLRILSLF